MNTQHGLHGVGGWARSRTGLVSIALLAIAGFFLVIEHSVHLYGLLPYALLLSCPLLHLFMHRGHGQDDSHQGHTGPNDKANGHESHF